MNIQKLTTETLNRMELGWTDLNLEVLEAALLRVQTETQEAVGNQQLAFMLAGLFLGFVLGRLKKNN